MLFLIISARSSKSADSDFGSKSTVSWLEIKPSLIQMITLWSNYDMFENNMMSKIACFQCCVARGDCKRPS